jgi:hypothetical protein
MAALPSWYYSRGEKKLDPLARPGWVGQRRIDAGSVGRHGLRSALEFIELRSFVETVPFWCWHHPSPPQQQQPIDPAPAGNTNMPSSLHSRWKRVKDELVKEAKPEKGLNKKPLEDALKLLSGGFGPTMDKMCDAFKANKGADVKKHAKASLAIAGEYKKAIATLGSPAASRMRFELDRIVIILKEIEPKGMLARPELFD